ncbi:hypothetical protein HDU97_005827 [Phlyctochytrium planicorne]|nr:hypothetical protein HDU97_005827 [Phlyctochytrium planicorne]
MRHRASEKISLSKLKQIALASKGSGTATTTSLGSNPLAPGTPHSVANVGGTGEGRPPAIVTNGMMAGVRGRHHPEPTELSPGTLGANSVGSMGDASEKGGRSPQEFEDRASSYRRFSFSSVSTTTTNTAFDRTEEVSGSDCGGNESRSVAAESVSSWTSASPVRSSREPATSAAIPLQLDQKNVEEKSISMQSSTANGTGPAADSGNSIMSAETQDQLASFLKDWADDFDKAIEGFFTKNKLFDLFGLWMMILLLDASLSSPTRIEWLGFCVLSLASFHRCIQWSFKSVFFLIVFYALSDTMFYLLLRNFGHPKLLPTLANMIVYGHVISCIRGLDPISWGLWASLLAVDLMAKEAPVSEMESMPAVHCVSYGFYLLLAELFTILTEYRNERLSNDMVQGELRLYPTSLMTSSLFSKEIDRVLDDRNELLKKKAELEELQKASPKSLPAPEDQESLRIPRAPTFYYYSNHYDLFNRFELCVSKISRDGILLTWSLPRSLIVTLSGLAKGDATEETPLKATTLDESISTTSTIRPPPPIIVSENSPLEAFLEPPVLDKCRSSHDRLVYQSLPPLTEPILITPEDIRVTVNGEEVRSGISLNLLDMTLGLFGLKVGVLLEIVLWIKGYSSIPLRICSSPMSPVRKPTNLVDSHMVDLEPVSLLDSKLLKRTELANTVDQEQQHKKFLQGQLKKMKKDFSKSLSSLRVEIDAIKKLTQKDSALEVKNKQRFQFLLEQFKQTEATIAKLKEDVAEMLQLERQRSEEDGRVSKDLSTMRESLKRMERASHKASAANVKVISSSESDLKETMASCLLVRDELDHIKNEMKKVKAETQAIPNFKPPKKLKPASKASVESLRKRLEAELNAVENDLWQTRVAYEGALDRNSQMRRTVEGEMHFKERLQDELRRVEMEKERAKELSRSLEESRVASTTAAREFSAGGFGWSTSKTWEDLNRSIAGTAAGFDGSGPLLAPSPPTSQQDHRWGSKMAFLEPGMYGDATTFSHFGTLSSKPSSLLDIEGKIPFTSVTAPPAPVLLATAAEDLKQGYDGMDTMLGPVGQDILTSLGLDDSNHASVAKDGGD